MRPEDELLLLCVLAGRTADQEARLRELVASPCLIWNDFWQHAVVQQVVPLVAGTLTDQTVAPYLPDHALHDAKKARAQKAAHSLALHSELQRLGAILHRRGIPVVPLKGTALGLRLYGCLGDRQTEDIDILVPEAHLATARAALHTLGFRPISDDASPGEAHPFHAMPLFRTAGAVLYVVELHWMLTDPRFCSVDYGALWTRIIAQRRDVGPFRVLPAEELLLFLAIHLFKHELVLRRLADIDRLIRAEGASIDWSMLHTLAARWSAAPALYFALDLSHRLFGTPVPPPVRRGPRPALWRRFLIHRLSGWRAVLGWAAPERRRYARSQLAYCATLHPWPRALDGYFVYLFPAPSPRRRGTPGAMLDFGQRLGGGAARTGLALLETVANPHG